MFSYIYACEMCADVCDMRAVCVRNVHALYLASDRYCIQCMCILKLCVLLKPGIPCGIIRARTLIACAERRGGESLSDAHAIKIHEMCA